MPEKLKTKLIKKELKSDKFGHVYGSSGQLHHQIAGHDNGTLNDITTGDISLQGKRG